jgi:hypothetical protein
MNKDLFKIARDFIVADIGREIALAKASEGWFRRQLLRLCGLEAGGGNFMAALSLLSYTEFAGRLMLSDFSDGNSRKSFDEFLRNMGTGYDDLLKKHNVYKNLRCGLAHEYFVKKSCTIAMLSSRPQPGVQWDGPKYIFIVESYLNDFRSAIDRLATRLFP